MVVDQPFIWGFNTTVYQDFQMIYWKPWLVVDGRWTALTQYTSLTWVPERGMAYFTNEDPNASVSDGWYQIRLYHEYWWYDANTRRWHYDSEWDPAVCR